MSLLLKINLGRDRRPSVVIMEDFNCQEEGGEVGKLKGSEMGRRERWDGSEVAKRERWESDKVRRWEVHGFIQGWGMQGQSQISSFCF